MLDSTRAWPGVSTMVVVHLVSSPFFGGPERQILGICLHLPEPNRCVTLLFDEGGRQRALADQLQSHRLEVIELKQNTPNYRAMVREVAEELRRIGADVLVTHGYKPNLVGRAAARRAGVPVVAVVHGWTGSTLKVRLYEAMDRLCLRGMDRVVCVSEGQAVKVRRAGVPPGRVVVNHNAIDWEPFARPDPEYRERLRAFFPSPPDRIVGAAGRLSPEKGFGVLVEAAAQVIRADPTIGFVHFGDGPLRATVSRQISEFGLEGRFILAGFRNDLDLFTPHWDLAVLPSFTEGLPCIALEAFAAGVPVVATSVGGLPEVVEEGVNGFLVPPGDPSALARRILDALSSEDQRAAMGRSGQERVRTHFTFEQKGIGLQKIFSELKRDRA
jgi:glycosyltransferase involved in cell wall biosynthesis